MNISAVRPSYSYNTVAFEKKPKEEYEEEDKNYTGQAVASFFIPGLGQFIKGDSDKGKRDLGIHLGIFASSIAAGFVAFRNMSKEFENYDMNKFKTSDIGKIYKSSAWLSAFVAVASIGSLINRVHSTYDAYTAVPEKLQQKTEDEEE